MQELLSKRMLVYPGKISNYPSKRFFMSLYMMFILLKLDLRLKTKQTLSFPTKRTIILDSISKYTCYQNCQHLWFKWNLICKKIGCKFSSAIYVYITWNIANWDLNWLLWNIKPFESEKLFYIILGKFGDLIPVLTLAIYISFWCPPVYFVSIHGIGTAW